MRRQQGAGGALIAVILALVALLILAVVSMTRSTDTSDERARGIANLNAAAAALDSYVSAAYRLPCPANPNPNLAAVPPEDGVETPNVPGGPTCQFPEGTIPWMTIGMRREDSFDAWGRKISYRVYTGNAGSLTQPGGMNMANCDVHEASPGGVTPTGGNSGGLCQPVPNNADPAARNTTPEQFLAGKTTPGQPTQVQILAGKGLTVNDMGTAIQNVAYVLISHGVTGLGGYTASGNRLDMPANNGAESDNTNATGPFTITAFSDPDTGSNVKAHFDDLLVYRGIVDLAKRANVAARSWPDTILSAIVFDKATVAAALGQTNPGSDTGTSTIAFNNATVTAFDSGGAQDISIVSGSGESGIGGATGDGFLSSAGGEYLLIDFAENARQFAFTLGNFDTVTNRRERVRITFFEVIDTIPIQKNFAEKETCNSSGNFKSFTIDAGTTFNRVEVRPLDTVNDLSLGNFASAFSLLEIRTCVAGVDCVTDLQPGGDLCSSKVFSPVWMGTGDTGKLVITLANNTSTSITGAAFTDTYPAGLVNASAAATTTCAGGSATPFSGGVALVGATVPRATSGSGPGVCTVTVDVTSSTAGNYPNSTGDITTTNAGTLPALAGTLPVSEHPIVAISFAPATVPQNTSSTLTITLSNPNPPPPSPPPISPTPTAIFGAAFALSYPAGLVNTNSPVTTCNGFATSLVNGTGVSLTDGIIPASGTCTITVKVTSNLAGTYTNALPAGAVTSDNAGANTVAASAPLTVN